MKARAAFFERAGQPIEIREVEVPAPEPDAIVIKVAIADICASDVHAWHGETPRSGPSILGHEMMGTVYQLGSNISTDSLGQPLAEGDRVVYSYILPCLRCRTCRSGNSANCPSRILSGRARSDEFPYLTGAFAEYYYLRPGHFVVKVDDDLSDELLAPLNCALVQVITGFRRAGLQWGHKVVIQGAGGLGLNAAAVAKEMGAEQVVVLDKRPERLELARQFGADHLVNVDDFANESERGRHVRRILNGGADIALELVGSPQVIPEGISMVAREGTYVIIGSIKVGTKIDFDPLSLVAFNRKVIGIGGYDPDTIGLAYSFIRRAKDRYPFDRIVSHKFRLDEVETALEKSAKGEVVRASIVFS
jgi:D-arabinose 1-dehydrogenase-like Zn-dependent alcohol dehydrogenase